MRSMSRELFSDSEKEMVLFTKSTKKWNPSEKTCHYFLVLNRKLLGFDQWSWVPSYHFGEVESKITPESQNWNIGCNQSKWKNNNHKNHRIKRTTLLKLVKIFWKWIISQLKIRTEESSPPSDYFGPSHTS